uniref:Sulfate_transp domain-containing protein n=1 Tax=Bursaphelenchus xylophilus TaxID=6326 RepID=A0A1I7SGV5_BURXY
MRLLQYFLYFQPKFEARYGRVDEPKESAAKKAMAKACESIRPRALFGFLSSLLPILEWLPAYRWKEDFMSDLIAGVTVGIMVVPQGMAYASLANVPPVVGLYANFIAIFIYMFFGTSRHISVGTFAVASMMVGNAQIIQFENFNATMSAWEPQMTKFGVAVSPLTLTSSLTLGVGVAQLVMGLFRLAFLTKYISDPLVSGFTTGAAMHVFMSQVPKAMGIKIPATPGIGELVHKVINCILGIPRINWVTFTIALLGCAFLWLGRDFLNPPFQKRFKLPIPFELILVIVSIVASQVFGFNKNFKVSIVKHVPNGLPPFALPNLSIIPHILPDIISISIICFMFAFSMSKLFAKKHKYKVDANQELHALGIVHAIASCFPVYPVGASLSRSSLCELAGARTQLNAIFTSALLFFVIMFIGHFLEPLPMAVLAAIVMVSLKSLFMQFGDIPRLWKLSKIDCVS